MIRCAAFGYLPPKGSFCVDAFAQNLKDYPPKHELILYSDDDWGDQVTRLKGSPEFLKGATFETGPQAGKPNPFAVHNVLFLAGLKMCRERGITHAIYLEQDCRVGVKGWDDVIFEEFFSLGRPCIVAGTVSVYNTSNNGLETARRFQKLMAEVPKHGVPMASYGWGVGAATPILPSYFPNGALAVYDVAWLCSMFDVEQQGGMAANNTAFDLAVGNKLWNLFELDAVEVIGSLSSVFSGFGDVLTTPEQRRELLTSGRVVAYHQEKTSYIP